MTQIIINILIVAFNYLIISLSFVVIYYPTKFFNLAHAGIIAIAPYFVYFFLKQLGLSMIISVIFSILLTIVLALILEVFIFKKLRQKYVSSLALLITSLGIYIIIESLISLFWGNDVLSIRDDKITAGHKLFNAYITSIQLSTIIVGVVLFVCYILIIKKSKFGLNLRAISSNEKFSKVFGINSDRIIVIAYIFGAFMAATIGILIGFDIDITPNMGFKLLLYGMIVMIIGGVRSTWGLVWGSLLLATAQNLGGYYISSKWMDAIGYIILILFLIWKPLGFSGKRMKKVEI